MGECLVICRFSNEKYSELIDLFAKLQDPVTTETVAADYAALATERGDARQVCEDLFGMFRPPADASNSYDYGGESMNEPRDGGDLPLRTSYSGGTRARILTPGQSSDPDLVNFSMMAPLPLRATLRKWPGNRLDGRRIRPGSVSWMMTTWPDSRMKSTFPMALSANGLRSSSWS